VLRLCDILLELFYHGKTYAEVARANDLLDLAWSSALLGRCYMLDVMTLWGLSWAWVSGDIIRFECFNGLD
jgi:hypothetical protein